MSFLPVNIFLLDIFLPVIILWIVLPVKKTSSPSLRNFDVFLPVIFLFTCENDIIPVLEEFASLSIA